MLKLWIVQRNDDRAFYMDYLGFVCAAETEDEARSMHPSGDNAKWEPSQYACDDWIGRSKASELSVRMIGIAAHNVAAGVLFTETQGD